MGQRQGEGGGVYGGGEGSAKYVNDWWVAGFCCAWFHEVGGHQIFSCFGENGKILVFVEGIQASSKHFFLQGNWMFFESSGRAFQISMFFPIIIDSELFTEFINNRMIESTFLEFFFLMS